MVSTKIMTKFNRLKLISYVMSKIIDWLHNLLTKNKLIVIIIIIIGIIGSLPSFKKEQPNVNQININNSSLINSPTIQQSSNISIVYNTPKNFDINNGECNPLFYIEQIGLLKDKIKYDFYSVKYILPDDQEAFIEKVLFNVSYWIGSCNKEFTDCCVYHKFRIKKSLDNNICWVHKTRFGHENLVSDIWNYTERVLLEPDKCVREVK